MHEVTPTSQEVNAVPNMLKCFMCFMKNVCIKKLFVIIVQCYIFHVFIVIYL